MKNNLNVGDREENYKVIIMLCLLVEENGGFYFIMDKYRKGYLIHETSDDHYCLCKILNEYNSEEEAEEALIDLLTHVKTEKQLLKEYSKKEVY
jgi:hypothetical protein